MMPHFLMMNLISVLLLLPLATAVDVIVQPSSASITPDFIGNDNNNTASHNPNSPLVLCSRTPSSFHTCELIDLSSVDQSKLAPNAPGCRVWGPGYYGAAPLTNTTCTVLDGIECYGARTWIEERICTRVTIFRFPTVLILSLVVGWLGVDRLYTSHIALGIFKLLSLGGVGVWWIVDLALLISGHFRPYDGSNWDVW